MHAYMERKERSGKEEVCGWEILLSASECFLGRNSKLPNLAHGRKGLASNRERSVS